ncbi:hypothetical protein Bbelb_391110 [Branchiostoma belcheri]|nr:hypothetical protein Bbelb_391110 [Branchiostoma belcheri]
MAMLTAFTGVAAFNINELTLHSAFLLETINKRHDYRALGSDRLNTLPSRLNCPAIAFDCAGRSTLAVKRTTPLSQTSPHKHALAITDDRRRIRQWIRCASTRVRNGCRVDTCQEFGV